MINHFLLDSGTGADSAAGCSAGDSAAGGSAACASGSASPAAGLPAVASSQTNCSSSCILNRLLCESALYTVDGFHQHRVHDLEIGREGEDSKDDDCGGALNLFSVGPG